MTSMDSTEQRIQSLEYELESVRATIEFGLSYEVYNFLCIVADTPCTVKWITKTSSPCGTCFVCKAHEFERKLRDRFVKLGWQVEACNKCKGSGIQRIK